MSTNFVLNGHWPSKLVVVAAHAAFHSQSQEADPSLRFDNHEPWVLQEYQPGESPLYGEHTQAGIDHAAQDPQDTLLVMSGGFINPESVSGPNTWSQARSYYVAAANMGWLATHSTSELSYGTPRRDFNTGAGRARGKMIIPMNSVVLASNGAEVTVGLSEYDRDSLENILGSVVTHYALAGRWPEKVTVFGWQFKADRFRQHANVLGLPQDVFEYIGVNDPLDIEPALTGEAKATKLFAEYPLGNRALGLPNTPLRAETLYDKRLRRDVLRRGNPAWGMLHVLHRHYQP